MSASGVGRLGGTDAEEGVSVLLSGSEAAGAGVGTAAGSAIPWEDRPNTMVRPFLPRAAVGSDAVASLGVEPSPGAASVLAGECMAAAVGAAVAADFGA